MMPDDPAITTDEHRNTRRVGSENEGLVSRMGNIGTDI
jgi:hypothetical protein